MAFTPTILKRGGYGLGIVRAGERGYYPYEGPVFETYQAAATEAERINEKLGLTPREAAEIVLGSMRPN